MRVEANLVVVEEEVLALQVLIDLPRWLAVVFPVALVDLNLDQPGLPRVVVAVDLYLVLVQADELLIVASDFGFGAR